MLKNQGFKNWADHVHVTTDEIRYIKKLSAHRPAPEHRKTNLHQLLPDELHVVMKRINAQRKRTNWDRARGINPPPQLTTKADWLRAYIRVAALRDDWGAIDAKEAVNAAKTLLEKQTAPIQRHVFGV